MYNRNFKSQIRSFTGIAVLWFLFIIVANLALLAGAVWVVAWVLRATGVIQ